MGGRGFHERGVKEENPHPPGVTVALGIVIVDVAVKVGVRVGCGVQVGRITKVGVGVAVVAVGVIVGVGVAVGLGVAVGVIVGVRVGCTWHSVQFIGVAVDPLITTGRNTKWSNSSVCAAGNSAPTRQSTIPSSTPKHIVISHDRLFMIFPLAKRDDQGSSNQNNQTNATTPHHVVPQIVQPITGSLS